MIVEDDYNLREALCEALELEGYQVVCLEHGLAALRHLEKAGPPCLILLDLMMPVMDGHAFRETILNEPHLADIPVIVITAGGPQMAAGVPAELVLHKPLKMGSVLKVVHQHCPDAEVPRPGR